MRIGAMGYDAVIVWSGADLLTQWTEVIIVSCHLVKSRP